VQLELRTGHDHRTTRIVNALTKQVLTEATLLALEHIAQRLERALVRAGDDAATTAVVEQRVNGLLKHTLFVADDDVRRAQFDQPLQTIVTVDHTAIKIVEIRGRKAAAIQRHKRAQLWRDHGDHFEDHPLGTIARFDEALDNLETLDDLLRFERRLGGRKLFHQIFAFLLKIEIHQHLLDGFGTDVSREGVFAILVLRLKQLVFSQQLELLKRGQARLDHDVALEVEDPL